MELNEYGIGPPSTRHHHNEISDQTRKYNGNSLDQIQATIPRKEQEFIDHTLLAPTYIRDSNNFIMDLIEAPAVFQKDGVVHVSTTTVSPDTDQDGYAVKDTLSSDLHFPNSIFHFVNKQEHVDGSEVSAVDSTLRAMNTQQQRPPRLVRADGSAFSHKHAGDFTLALNGDFLETSENKSFCGRSERVGGDEHGTAHGTVRRFPSLSLLAEPNVVALEDTGVMHDEGNILYARSNARKVLPHKKRISRKLKVDQNDGNCSAAFVTPLEHNKLPQEDRLTVVVGSMQFSCEICGHTTSTQIEFFSHLKQHYEPSTPDTILAAMKTSLDALDSAPPDKECNNVCSINNKKADENNVDHQVFHAVHLNFEDFHNVDDSVRNVMHQHQQNQDNDMKILNSNSLGNSIAAYVTQAEATPALKDMATDEFSDTEDMLEGIRNVVDKVSIEDTCDDIDLMSPNAIRAPWFTSDSFSGITFKSKPFSDVSFSEPLESALRVEMDNNSLETESKERPQQQQQHPLEISNSNDVMAHFVASNEQKIEIEDNAEPGSAYFVPPLPTNHSDNSYECESVIKSDDVAGFTKDSNDGSQSRRMQLRLPKLKSHQQQYLEEDEYEAGQGEAKLAEDFIFDDDDEDYATPERLRGKKRQICTKCNREFNSGNALKYHYRTHTGIRPHQCEVCGKSFFAQGALKSHMRTHTGDKPFECEQCHRKFRQWGDLKYHTISIHSDEKSHQCEFCGKAFSRKYSLVLHRRIHTSERNYKCEYCPKTFRASTYLRNHVKIHTGEKPYECKVCTKKFRVSGDLARHKRIHQRKLIKEEEIDDGGVSEGEDDQNKV